MSNYALVKDGKVMNVIVIDKLNDYPASKDVNLIECDGLVVSIGDFYVDGVFTPATQDNGSF